MSKAHYAEQFPDYDRMTHATGPTFGLNGTTHAANQPYPTMNDSASLAQQFNDKVADHQRTTGADFSAAWDSCKRLHPTLWNDWQTASKAANVRAANAATTASDSSGATAQFNQHVQDRMRAAGETFEDAWSYIQQTQPWIYNAMMNGGEPSGKVKPVV